MPTVKSRFNGLIINIPADARGVTGRFYSQGGNELIFDQSAKAKQKSSAEQDAPVKIDSELRKDSDTQHEADIA